jgi:hypothetical protein
MKSIANKSIVNKDNELIKTYLTTRENIINELKNNNFSIDYWLNDNESDDWLINLYDDHITSTKLSEKSKKLLDLMLIVDYDYIIYDDNSYNPKLKSFKNVNDRNDCQKLNNYYLDIKEIDGSLEDNYDELVENFENGDALFIQVDSIYTNNIRIAILNYTDYDN